MPSTTVTRRMPTHKAKRGDEKGDSDAEIKVGCQERSKKEAESRRQRGDSHEKADGRRRSFCRRRRGCRSREIAPESSGGFWAWSDPSFHLQDLPKIQLK